MRLHGRRVLLTGASRGIGAALARGFHAAGARLAVVARPSDELDHVAREVDGTAYPCDLAVPDEVAGLVARVEADGPIDVLVNNAGLSAVGWFGDRTHDELDRVLAVNLTAPVHLCRDVLPGMLERARGHIVNVSSMAAVIAPPGLAVYGASKAGLTQFASGLRADLRDDPVAVTTVHVGSVDTDLDHQSREYGPLRQLAAQSKGGDMTEMSTLVRRVVAAVEAGRDEVRAPAVLAPMAAIANAPRVAGRLLFRSVPARERRTDGVA